MNALNSHSTPLPLAPRMVCERLQLGFGPGHEILRGLSLEIPAGEIVCLIGASGCGKSTLLKCLSGLLQPEAGMVRVEREGSDTSHHRMAFVFQEPTLLPWRTVRSNVRLPLELLGLTAQPAYVERIDRFLQIVGLSERDQQKYPAQLSGGMKMRVSLARALVTDPDLLFFDEPFAALDDVLRMRLNELLLELVAERPRTVVFVTHNIAEAMFLSHRIVIMAQGAVAEIIENPLPTPRQRDIRSTSEFANLYGRVSLAMEHAAS